MIFMVLVAYWTAPMISKGESENFLTDNYLLLVTGHFLSIDFLYVKTKFLIRVTKCFLK